MNAEKDKGKKNVFLNKKKGKWKWNNEKKKWTMYSTEIMGEERKAQDCKLR